MSLLMTWGWDRYVTGSAEAATRQHIPVPELQQGPSASVSSFAATPTEQQIQSFIDGLTAAGVPSLASVSPLPCRPSLVPRTSRMRILPSSRCHASGLHIKVDASFIQVTDSTRIRASKSVGPAAHTIKQSLESRVSSRLYTNCYSVIVLAQVPGICEVPFVCDIPGIQAFLPCCRSSPAPR